MEKESVEQFLHWCLLTFMAAKYATASLYYNNEQLEKDEIIEAVNNANTTWKAGRNFYPSLTQEYTNILFGLREPPEGSGLPVLEDDDEDIYLPESFDARQKWRNCSALQTVRDQASCGSCWAVSTTSVFTDRLCIASKGRFNSQLSAQYLMSCCQDCGEACDGGYKSLAFKYFEEHGIVTGGDYKSHVGCQPYTLPKCDHYGSGKYKKCGDSKPTLKCQSSCYNKKYKSSSFEKDLHFAREGSSFKITHNVKQMQKEIYKNGPLVASFYIYEDFLSYKSNVYTHVTGKKTEIHAVKVIGWGVEGNTPYWLAANSWNEDWGDKGFFKIRRGKNECKIEESMLGCIPNLSHL